MTLCTPSGLHGRMAVQAARAGKHVLSEKPLDVWLDAVDEAIAAAKSAGVVYGGVFQERFSPAARKVKRAIDAGAFGDIVLACAETKWYRGQGYYDTGAWRGTWDLDAGVFSNQGIHSLDKVQWLAGPVAEVLSATLTPGFHRDIEGETLGVVTVRFESGALGTLTMTTLAYDGFPERVDVSGTKGSAMLVGDHLAHFKTQEPFEDSGPPDSPMSRSRPQRQHRQRPRRDYRRRTSGQRPRLRPRRPRRPRAAGFGPQRPPRRQAAEHDLREGEGGAVCVIARP